MLRTMMVVFVFATLVSTNLAKAEISPQSLAGRWVGIGRAVRNGALLCKQARITWNISDDGAIVMVDPEHFCLDNNKSLPSVYMRGRFTQEGELKAQVKVPLTSKYIELQAGKVDQNRNAIYVKVDVKILGLSMEASVTMQGPRKMKFYNFVKNGSEHLELDVILERQ